MHQISEVAQLHDDAQEVVEKVNLISNPQNAGGNMHPVSQIAQLHGEAQEVVQEVIPIVDPHNGEVIDIDSIHEIVQSQRGAREVNGMENQNTNAPR